MIRKTIPLNTPQVIATMSNARSQVNIWGRGTGKSFIVETKNILESEANTPFRNTTASGM